MQHDQRINRRSKRGGRAMSQISVRQGIAIFLVTFVLPVLILLPFRAELMTIVPQPTLWQTLNNVLGSILLTGLLIYSYNKRQRIQEQDREIERLRSQREH
jgi:4-hydroxybenzoate polyprenyltransferase